jgi:hypothetical protein
MVPISPGGNGAASLGENRMLHILFVLPNRYILLNLARDMVHQRLAKQSDGFFITLILWQEYQRDFRQLFIDGGTRNDNS